MNRPWTTDEFKHFVATGNVPKWYSFKQDDAEITFIKSDDLFTKITPNNSIFIEGNTPSSKNSKRWVGTKLISSKIVYKFIKNTSKTFADNQPKFSNFVAGMKQPLAIGFYFVRNSKRRFDYNNASQLITDLMKKNGYIEDDNASVLIPVFLGFHKDTEKPGVYIVPLKNYFKAIKTTINAV